MPGIDPEKAFKLPVILHKFYMCTLNSCIFSII